MEEAERIAKEEHGSHKIAVISGETPTKFPAKGTIQFMILQHFIELSLSLSLIHSLNMTSNVERDRKHQIIVIILAKFWKMNSQGIQIKDC